MLKNRGGRHGMNPKVTPNTERLDWRVLEIRKSLRKLKFAKNKEFLVSDINLINSQIRGIINYYSMADGVNEGLRRYRETLKYASYKAIKKYGGRWLPANKSDNLKEIHENRKEQIPMIEYSIPEANRKGKLIAITKMKIGITCITFACWRKVPMKKLIETPYTSEGREHNLKRTSKNAALYRADEMFNESLSILIAFNAKSKIYNFEYLMNRGYTFNRDKGKCRCCKAPLMSYSVHIHHVNPNLPINEINKVKNLASVCQGCHTKIHNNSDLSEILQSVAKRINGFRRKLV